jgi:hypothetical protein
LVGAAPTIFISIAAYRDPELLPTVRDCLAKARFPERLRFGICWQHEDNEPRPSLFDDRRFQVLPIHWRDSKGACWARASLMGLLQGETWFLQLDSHHRFAADWDVKLLDEAASTGSLKPVLTTYAASFLPGDDGSMSDEPLQMNFDRFTDDGIILFRPGVIPDWRDRTTPVPARFISAHFLFAPASFVRDVPYDPELYFLGEEITLTVRAFTHGYDLFHPLQPIVWHEYTRSYRAKHWNDHTAENGIVHEWHQRDAVSREKIGKFLHDPHTGAFGCGTARTFADYQAYAGFDFRLRRAQEHTRANLPPPNHPAPSDWAQRIADHRIRIAVDPQVLPPAALQDPMFWYVGLFDKADREIFRQDADEPELCRLLGGDPASITLARDFESCNTPTTWAIWPYSKSSGWLEKVTGPLVADSLEADVLRGALGWGTGADLESHAAQVYPLAVPGLNWAHADDQFKLTRAGEEKGYHLLNNTGALLLELANGRYSLAEIFDVVVKAYGLSQSPRQEIVQFFEFASRESLVRMRRVPYDGEEHGNRQRARKIRRRPVQNPRLAAAIH